MASDYEAFCIVMGFDELFGYGFFDASDFEIRGINSLAGGAIR
jgi:hypothetical protein